MSVHCCIHQGDIPDGVRVVLVTAIEQGSGPGIPVYACEACVDKHSVVPFAENEGEEGPVYGQPLPGIRRAP